MLEIMVQKECARDQRWARWEEFNVLEIKKSLLNIDFIQGLLCSDAVFFIFLTVLLPSLALRPLAMSVLTPLLGCTQL